MIKLIHVSLLLFLHPVFTGAGLKAQVKNADKPDNLQQQKVSFFNEKLQLSAAESAKFWPVYTDYQNRRDKITRDRNTLMQYFEMNKANLSESEATASIAKYVAFQQEETRLLETYTRKFQEFLPSKKVLRIYLVELEFKKWLLENLRQNKVQSTTRN
jgi:hypothetical protein